MNRLQVGLTLLAIALSVLAVGIAMHAYLAVGAVGSCPTPSETSDGVDYLPEESSDLSSEEAVAVVKDWIANKQAIFAELDSDRAADYLSADALRKVQESIRSLKESGVRADFQTSLVRVEQISEIPNGFLVIALVSDTLTVSQGDSVQVEDYGGTYRYYLRETAGGLRISEIE